MNEYVEYLKGLGTDKLSHSGRSLLDHLIGVSNLLKENGRDEVDQAAGLFHSIYGTEYYKHSEKLEITRPEIINLIGPDAEFLVWLFCKTERRTIRILEDDWFDEPERTSLRWIEYCNLIEQKYDNEFVYQLKEKVNG